jgi:DNA sulfur modification protein DndD
MKVRRVKFKNFRQFYGEQEIEFACGKGRNVTLIHAENGFGKTTILNAVLWALFGQLTKKFEDPDKIVCFAAEDEEKHTAAVDVEFEFNQTHYLATRHFDDRVDKKDKTKLAAYRIQSGVHQPIDAPETFISSVIPPEMAKYFFFDGEAAQAFSEATNFKAVGAAIRSILGCELADTAIEDLKETTKFIDKEIGRIADDGELHNIEKEITNVTHEVEIAYSAKGVLETNVATLKSLRDELTESLRGLEGARHTQAQRDDKERQLKQVGDAITSTTQDVVKWVGQRAIQVVSGKLAQQTFDFITEASLKGRIPSPYNEEFVKGLLQKEICICDRELKPSTPHWKAVANLLKNASNAEVMGRVVRARARVSVLREEAGDAVTALTKLQGTLAGHIKTRNRLEREIAELGKQLENVKITEIAEKERARRKFDDNIAEENIKLGGVKATIHQLETRKAQLVTDLERISKKNKQAHKLLTRRTLLVQSSSLLTSMLREYEKTARGTLQSEVNGILEKIAHKDYTCRLNPDFRLELILSNRVNPKSGGENQLLSLVFVASLIRFAASRIDDNDLLLKPGTVAPLILDAPLGQLDEDYQRSTAEYIPRLAQQVVLLVSSSQGGEKVLEALKPYVGAEYVLISENKGPRDKKKEVRRVLHGKEYVCTLFNRPIDISRIERVS